MILGETLLSGIVPEAEGDIDAIVDATYTCKANIWYQWWPKSFIQTQMSLCVGDDGSAIEPAPGASSAPVCRWTQFLQRHNPVASQEEVVQVAASSSMLCSIHRGHYLCNTRFNTWSTGNMECIIWNVQHIKRISWKVYLVFGCFITGASLVDAMELLEELALLQADVGGCPLAWLQLVQGCHCTVPHFGGWHMPK